MNEKIILDSLLRTFACLIIANTLYVFVFITFFHINYFLIRVPVTLIFYFILYWKSFSLVPIPSNNILDFLSYFRKSNYNHKLKGGKKHNEQDFYSKGTKTSCRNS